MRLTKLLVLVYSLKQLIDLKKTTENFKKSLISLFKDYKNRFIIFLKINITGITNQLFNILLTEVLSQALDKKLLDPDKLHVKIYLFCYDGQVLERDTPAVS